MNIRLVVICLFVIVSGCYSDIDRNVILGVYHANHNHGDESLEIFTNGEYLRTYIDVNGEVNINKNTWSFDYGVNHEPRLTFNNYIFGYRDKNIQNTVPGTWNVEVERSLTGKIMLNINPDLDFYFVKN